MAMASPLLVISTDCPVRFTLSRTARQVALNCEMVMTSICSIFFPYTIIVFDYGQSYHNSSGSTKESSFLTRMFHKGHREESENTGDAAFHAGNCLSSFHRSAVNVVTKRFAALLYDFCCWAGSDEKRRRAPGFCVHHAHGVVEGGKMRENKKNRSAGQQNGFAGRRYNPSAGLKKKIISFCGADRQYRQGRCRTAAWWPVPEHYSEQDSSQDARSRL